MSYNKYVGRRRLLIGTHHISDIDSTISFNLNRLPKVEDALARKPDWLSSLATGSGILDLERQRGFKLPDDLVDYYASTWLSCFLYAYWDVDAFLEDLDDLDEPMPPTVLWGGSPCLVIGHFVHADCVCAVSIDHPRPLINWGSFTEPFNTKPLIFRDWLAGAVERQLAD